MFWFGAFAWNLRRKTEKIEQNNSTSHNNDYIIDQNSTLFLTLAEVIVSFGDSDMLGDFDSFDSLSFKVISSISFAF